MATFELKSLPLKNFCGRGSHFFDILEHPQDYGLPSPGPIPASLTLGLDETPPRLFFYVKKNNLGPLLYCPKVKTYELPGTRRVVIRGSSEKRSLTATPITSKDGALARMFL